METFQVQVRVGDRFEDLYIDARDENEARDLARDLSTFSPRELRWASFVI